VKTEEFRYHLHEASRAKMSGKTMEAVMHLSRAITLNPSSAASHYELAGLYMYLGDLKKATYLAERAVRLNPNQEWYKILLAELYKASGKIADAVKVTGELIKLSPGNPEYYYQRAEMFRYLKKYDAALKEFDNIENIFGFSEQVALSREELWLLKGDENKALAEIQKLVIFFPGETRYLGMLAETYMNRKNLVEAWKYYSKMLETDSTNGLLRLSLAEYYRLNREYDKSFGEMKRAFASQDVYIDTKVRMLVSMITYMNASSELKEQVYSLIQILLETHPDEPQPHAFYADFLINEREYEQARNELRIVLQSEKKQYMIWEQLLILNSQLNDFASLLDESEKALEYFPNQPMVYYFKGLALYSMKLDSAAVPVLNTGADMVINNDPLRLQFYNILAESCNRIKDYGCSDYNMERALQLDPQNLPLLNNYAYYLSVRKEKLDKAEKMSRITIEVENSNSTYLDTYAWVLYQQGNYKKALEYIEEAMKHGGKNNGVITEHYGDILFKTGQKDQAVSQWEKARELGNKSLVLERKINEKILTE
jgi:tetratricopeptide (TPR) repeat protein